MSYINPIEKNINDPRFADRAAQKIQIALSTSNLPWLELSHGRARIGKKESNGALVTYPEVQQTFGRDYIDAMPNDNTFSQSYVLITNERVQQAAEGKNIVNWIADCSVVFFIRNLNEIDTSYGSNIEQLLRGDIQKALTEKARNFIFDEDTTWTDEIEAAYAEFTKPIDEAFKNDHKKYAYLRINGKVDFKTPCVDIFPYDGSFQFDPLKDRDFIYATEPFLTY